MAIVVPNLDELGGMERQAALLAESLAARGIPVTIVTTRTVSPLTFPPHPVKPCLERRGPIEIVQVPVFGNWTLRAFRQLTVLATTWALMRRRRRLGVVCAIQYTGSLYAALGARVAGLPAVVKFAGGGQHGDLLRFGRDEDAAEILEGLRGMDRYIIISEEIGKEAEAAEFDPARFVRIRNGVDTRTFSPGGAERSGGDVLFVGRLGPEKRLDVLLRAFARVVKEVPEARLVLAGSGPLLEELRALARELGITGEVSFLGTRSDVNELHRRASVFVLPSASEGLPNALLEALASGTPAVATEIPGTTDVVSHEEEALLVPVGDVAGLAAAIVRLLRDRELARRLAVAGRARIQAEFDMERVTDRYVAIFSELAARPRPSDLASQVRFVRTVFPRVVRLAFAVGRIQARDAITAAVVAAKRLLGIQGDIWRGPAAQA